MFLISLHIEFPMPGHSGLLDVIKSDAQYRYNEAVIVLLP